MYQEKTEPNPELLKMPAQPLKDVFEGDYSDHEDDSVQDPDEIQDHTDDEGDNDGAIDGDVAEASKQIVGGSGHPDDRLPSVSDNINADVDDGGEELNLQEAKEAVNLVRQKMLQIEAEETAKSAHRVSDLAVEEEKDSISVLSPPRRPAVMNRRDTDASSAYRYNQDNTPSEIDYADSVHQGIRIKKVNAMSAKNSQQIAGLLEAVSRLETRLANSEAENRSTQELIKTQQRAMTDIISSLDQTRSALEKLDVGLNSLSKDHTKAYEGLAHDFSRLERISKNAVAALEAAHEVDEINPEVPEHVVATRQAMREDLETPAKVDLSAKIEKPKKPSLPAWLAASMKNKS